MTQWANLVKTLAESKAEEGVRLMLEKELSNKAPRLTMAIRIYQRYSKLRRAREMSELVEHIANKAHKEPDNG